MPPVRRLLLVIDVSLQTEAVYVPVAVILTLIMECAVNWPDPPPPGMRVSLEGIRAAGHFIESVEILTTAAFFCFFSHLN